MNEEIITISKTEATQVFALWTQRIIAGLEQASSDPAENAEAFFRLAKPVAKEN